ncbi:hypothetical protein [Parabacteroides timonensis]|uniref:hypothetical protein n=1 Tax=Parabacteroides timonensis TaxID=1871013 RepID=UPI000B2DE3E7|nr:hypothetical protein [Parabacteroides timonensis]
MPNYFFGVKGNIYLIDLWLTILAMLAVNNRNTEVALAAIGAILSISGKPSRHPKK